MAPPANVPSWWGFNEAVLDELRTRFVAEHAAPVRARAALNRLSLERGIPVEEFSQIVSDAFAGATWFDALAALDGTQPNRNHLVLADLAASNRLHAVVTTNFDSLIERALAARGCAFDKFDALADSPPAHIWTGNTRASDCKSTIGTSLIIKAHGTAPRASSLIDLANQKRRGLPPQWLDVIEQLFATSPVLVVGFSGVDLQLADDYLRMRAASTSTPWMRWLLRPGQAAPDRVTELVASGGPRFAFIRGDLPDAWNEVGVSGDELTTAMPAEHEPTDQPDVGSVIDKWLAEPMVDADTCGLALTRLLDASGSHSAAQALRTSILSRVKRSLQAGVSLTGAARAGLQIGQLASDEPTSRATRALYDLGLAQRALDAVVAHFDESERNRHDVVEEMAHNTANLLQNRAYIYLQLGDSASARIHAERALPQMTRLAGIRLRDHEASHHEILAAAADLEGQTAAAISHWSTALAICLETGNLRRAIAVRSNLDRLRSDQTR